MNLLKDKWLPIIRHDGSRDVIAIYQITQHNDKNPVIEIDAPRPDFRNGLYQLLIGIIQVSALPEDEDEWEELFYLPYSTETLKDKILHYEDCFEIDSEGPAFMQDYDLLEDQEVENLRNLFVYQASEPNVYFNKRIPLIIDAYWGVIALYCLNTYGPPGGAGHKTGNRGAGPVTTILIPGDKQKRSTSLWEKIWFNVFPEEEVQKFTGNYTKKEKSDIFPWMKPTVVSDKNGKYVYPQECNPLVMYFAMPRRIRLVFDYREGVCDITGEKTNAVVTGYKTKTNGNDYKGNWIHPLTAYKKDRQGKNPPNPQKCKPGVLTYRNWMLFSFDYPGKESEFISPFSLTYAQSQKNCRKQIVKERDSITWNSGFHLDNMKARCWYEAVMPVYPLDSGQASFVKSFTENAIAAAKDCIAGLKKGIKTSWYKRDAKEVKGEFSFLDNDFYSKTENDFYRVLDTLVKNVGDDDVRSNCSKDWEKIIKQNTLEIFDSWSLAEQEDGLDMKRVIKGRRIAYGGVRKAFKKMSVMQKEAQ